MYGPIFGVSKTRPLVNCGFGVVVDDNCGSLGVSSKNDK